MATKKELAKVMMNVQDIQTRMNEKTTRRLNAKETSKIIDAITGSITELLVKDGKVQLIGFGTFEKRERAARSGRNPQTGETIEIESTVYPAFKPGKDLKEIVKPKVKKAKKSTSS